MAESCDGTAILSLDRTAARCVHRYYFLFVLCCNLLTDYSVATPDLKSRLAGQIARACAVFCVDEVVIFDDGQAEVGPPEHDGYTAFRDPNFFLYHVLSYLETPPHLRKALFPMHPDLKTAGALPSLDMPHHLRGDEWCPYREAIAIRQKKNADGTFGTLLDCGLPQHVYLPVVMEEKTRVTVKLPEHAPSSGGEVSCQAVSPDAPREEAGYYWGYSVRQAPSLSSIFTECPHDGGYDMSIGTSERGIPVSSVLADDESHVAPEWNHLLIVFGGVAGLEAALSSDTELLEAGVTDPKELFDRYVNLVPGQGSRTIRTEEAVWAGLTALRPLVDIRNAV